MGRMIWAVGLLRQLLETVGKPRWPGHTVSFPKLGLLGRMGGPNGWLPSLIF